MGIESDQRRFITFRCQMFVCLAHRTRQLSLKLNINVTLFGNLRGMNCRVLFTKRLTNNHLIPTILTVSDRIQILSKKTHKVTGTQVNTPYYLISLYSVNTSNYSIT